MKTMQFNIPYPHKSKDSTILLFKLYIYDIPIMKILCVPKIKQ